MDADENEEIDHMTESLSTNFMNARQLLNKVNDRTFATKMEERIAKNLASRYAEDISDFSVRFRKCQGKSLKDSIEKLRIKLCNLILVRAENKGSK